VPQEPQSKRNPNLDALRGLAILLVFLFHYGGGLKSPHLAIRLLGYLTQTGWTGVTLFFALSGFLITGQLWDSLQSPDKSRPRHLVRNFYLRRALRILPLYYAVLLIAAIGCIAVGFQFIELGHFVLYALFLQNLPVISNLVTSGDIPAVLPLYHLWSLAVEEQFYLLWPALLFLAANPRRPSNPTPQLRTKRALYLCLWIFALTTLFRILIWSTSIHPAWAADHLFDQFLLTHAGALALGAATAITLRDPTLWPKVQRYAAPTLLASLAIYIIASTLRGSFLLNTHIQYTYGLTAISIASAATIPIALRESRRLYPLSSMVYGLVSLGRISYGFYIFHILLQPLFDNLAIHLTHTAEGTPYQTARFFIAFPLTTLIAWLSFRYFEEPILQLNRHFPLHNPLPVQ